MSVNLDGRRWILRQPRSPPPLRGRSWHSDGVSPPHPRWMPYGSGWPSRITRAFSTPTPSSCRRGRGHGRPRCGGGGLPGGRRRHRRDRQRAQPRRHRDHGRHHEVARAPRAQGPDTPRSTDSRTPSRTRGFSSSPATRARPPRRRRPRALRAGEPWGGSPVSTANPCTPVGHGQRDHLTGRRTNAQVSR